MRFPSSTLTWKMAHARRDLTNLVFNHLSNSLWKYWVTGKFNEISQVDYRRVWQVHNDLYFDDTAKKNKLELSDFCNRPIRCDYTIAWNLRGVLLLYKIIPLRYTPWMHWPQNTSLVFFILQPQPTKNRGHYLFWSFVFEFLCDKMMTY